MNHSTESDLASVAKAEQPVLSTDFPSAYTLPILSAVFRQSPQDFCVDEDLGFPLTGQGEHQCLLVEKTSHNTHWVLAALAEFAGVSEKDIGYCGRKDRHAITRQWFSLYCPPVSKLSEEPVREPVDWTQFSMEGVEILSVDKHAKKLRLGDHANNQFLITLRDVRSRSSTNMKDEVASSLTSAMLTEHQVLPVLSLEDKQNIANKIIHTLKQGVPNYFGAQRFGREGNNLVMANDWLVRGISPPRKQRSMILSAARSYVFNRVLACRVSNATWKTVLDGDVVNTIHPTGPLWGRGRLATKNAALAVEDEAIGDLAAWCERLEHLGLKQERRELVLTPDALDLRWEGDDLLLSFTLPSGTFATAILAEVAQLVTS
jgi:tRNA pseudouridine13 synthase